MDIYGGSTRWISRFCGTKNRHICRWSQAHDQCTPEACECGNSRTHVQLACCYASGSQQKQGQRSNQRWLILLMDLMGNIEINMIPANIGDFTIKNTWIWPDGIPKPVQISFPRCLGWFAEACGKVGIPATKNSHLLVIRHGRSNTLRPL